MPLWFCFRQKDLGFGESSGDKSIISPPSVLKCTYELDVS